MILFYRERNGDYLAIDTASNDYYVTTLGHDTFEGRATAVAGLIGSVCTTGVGREYLRACCQRVPKSKVPAEWRRAIDL